VLDGGSTVLAYLNSQSHESPLPPHHHHISSLSGYMCQGRLKSSASIVAVTLVTLCIVFLSYDERFLEMQYGSMSSTSHLGGNRTHHPEEEEPPESCALEIQTVHGTDFFERWPNYSPDIWNDDQPNITDTPPWPSNLSEICANHGDFEAILRVPPLYNSRDRPTGLRIVMLGDSIMRYHFIMLIHYLHTGEWIHKSMVPNLLNEKTFAEIGWLAFYGELRSYFEPEHFLCDCFRRDESWTVTLLDNEHYRDQGCHDNSISFFSKFGNLGFRGYHNASDINSWFQNANEGNGTNNVDIPDDVYVQGNFRWTYYGYEEFLRNIVDKMEPRPRLVVINEGIWTPDNLSDEATVRKIRDTIRDMGMISIYKTTTKFVDDKESGLFPHDEMCCRIFDHCLRMDWTACVDETEYLDAVHFNVSVNLRSSEMLLDVLVNIDDVSLLTSSESPSDDQTDQQELHQSTIAPDCSLETQTVHGTDFFERWPNYGPDIWNDDQPNITGTPAWPSNLSQICAAQGDLEAIVRLPPLYSSKDRPTGLRIVMLGDSIMRYHFLMLVHYLHTGQWIHDSMVPNILNETAFGSWPAFYTELRSYFQPKHFLCDCFRGNDPDVWKATLLDNEHYRDQGCHDNSISFFSKFGDFGFRGSHNVSDNNSWFRNAAEGNGTNNENILDEVYEQGDFTWLYFEYEEFLRNIVDKMDPRPRLVVINEGIWTSDNLSDEATVREIRDTIRDLGMISVYKTTTKFINDKEPGLAPHDEMCCRIFDHCLRMDWTACVDEEEYWDGKHFNAYVNLRSSEMLLDLLVDRNDMFVSAVDRDAA